MRVNIPWATPARVIAMSEEEKYMVFVFLGILVMVMVMEVRGIRSTVTQKTC